jgi:hypothetical protein
MSKEPKFPGFAACMRMMRKHDPHTRESGFRTLLPHAAEHVEELMQQFASERDHGLRCWLLELIGEARSPVALSLLVEQLQSPEEAISDWAARGLRALDTPEARQALFDAGLPCSRR